MYIIVVGSKITPPWDSAAASLGRGLLQALTYLGYKVIVVTSRVSLKRIIRNYGYLPSGVKDFETSLRINTEIRWCVIEHSSKLCTEIKLATLTNLIANHAKADAVFHVGFPRNPLILRVIGRICKAVILYTYTIPSIQYLSLLKCFLSYHKRFKLIICTTSFIAYRIITEHLGISQVYVLPPIIDTCTFRPLDNMHNEFKFTDNKHLHIGYVGPVHPPRLPISCIAKALALLRREGLNIVLHVRGVLRHGRKDLLYVETIKRVLRKVLGNENVYVQVGQLSREELNRFYNMVDVLLYIFTLSREAEVADPPLIPLEALSAGTPVVCSSSSSLDYYLKPLLQMGAVRLTERNPLDIARAICELSSTSKKNLSKTVHEYVDQVFSPRSVSLRIRKILEEIL